jgi:hypothetical protein
MNTAYELVQTDQWPTPVIRDACSEFHQDPQRSRASFIPHCTYPGTIGR